MQVRDRVRAVGSEGMSSEGGPAHDSTCHDPASQSHVLPAITPRITVILSPGTKSS